MDRLLQAILLYRSAAYWPFLTRGWGARHKDAGPAAICASLARTGAGNHQQKRLQEAGPDANPKIGYRTRGIKMFAVFKTGGKQYRVAAEDVLKVAKLKGEPGEIVEFGEVLVVGGDNVSLGAPTVSGATVAAQVLEQGRGPKIIAFKKRRRKNSRRKRGFREEFTLLRITEILTDGQKASKEAPPRPARAPKPAAAAEGEEGVAEASAPTAKKKKASATKKPAAKGKKKK
jgi:large subunit ribosomal protein L21